jgi:hypothetical protein
MSAQVNGKSATAGKPKGAAAAGGAGAKTKKAGAAATKTATTAANGAGSDISSLPELTEWSTTSKPDRATYDSEQNAIRALLDQKQAQLVRAPSVLLM